MSLPFYITTPIYYVNDIPHIGHAYTTIVADVLARFHRSCNQDVYFLTGTDEHGQKVERAASENNLEPKLFTDRVMARFKTAWEHLNISNNDFIRTTDPRHHAVVATMWRRMQEAGDIYLGEYDGLYCVGCEEYYTDLQATDGQCPIHRKPLEKLKQQSYFFKMSRYQDALLEHFTKHPDFVQPEIRRNEIVSFIQSGLRDLSISRTSFRWGIPVPDDDQHVIYVWVDALTNYISALGQPGDSATYQKYWPATCHLIGKDILRFHAVYWPAMLLSAKLPLPKHIFAHGWWTVNGEKMSKSLRNAVDPEMLVQDIGCDALRYFLVRETPLGNDGDFAHAALFRRINSELGNDLGNLVNRSLAMANKYCAGAVPTLSPNCEPIDTELIELATRCRNEAVQHFEAYAPSRALDSIWELIRATNKYVDSTAPFKLAKEEQLRPRLLAVMAHTLEAIRWIGAMVSPVMPEKANQLFAQLGMTSAHPDFARLTTWPVHWEGLPTGLALQVGTPLFPRIEPDQQAALMNKWIGSTMTESAASEKKAPQPEKTATAEPVEITYDEFSRLDLRVATVISAQRVAGTDRLLQLTVDLGSEQRQIVSGIADVYAPEAMVGKQVVIVANLKPAKIRGIVSHGMILAAGDKEVLALGALDRPVPPGSKVR